MDPINMLEAKSSLSRLVEAVETRKQAEIVIARNGRPAARLVPIEPRGATGARIGVARGHFVARALSMKTTSRLRLCSAVTPIEAAAGHPYRSMGSQ